MLTRERTPSASSCSSSPLNVDFVEPYQYPKPPQTGPMAEFNQIFTRRMKTFCAILKNPHAKFKPTPELHNKFFMARWKTLLESFEEELIQVWQATIVKETGEKYLMMALTDSKEPPKIQNVDSEDVVNIRTIPIFDKYTSELSKMILLRMETPKTYNRRICRRINRSNDSLQLWQDFRNKFGSFHLIWWREECF